MVMLRTPSDLEVVRGDREVIECHSSDPSAQYIWWVCSESCLTIGSHGGRENEHYGPTYKLKQYLSISNIPCNALCFSKLFFLFDPSFMVVSYMAFLLALRYGLN